MTTRPLPEPLPYHRLARLPAGHRWWHPLTGTLFVAVVYTFAVGALYAALDGWGGHRGYPRSPDGTVEFGPLPDTAVGLVLLALATPVVLLAARWTGQRPAGTVSSVTGGLRWRWLLLCLLTALPVLAMTMGAMLLLPADGGDPFRWAGWTVFGPALALLLVLVPLQAAAEEYVFRGWLTQAVGALVRSPWGALLPQALLFAAAHGWGTPWGFADLVVFGAAAGWLTWRTGGLEAAIGLHAANNLLAFAASAATVDGLRSDGTAADSTWPVVALDVLGIALYTTAVLWLLRSRALVRTAVPAPLPPAGPLAGPGAGPAAGRAAVPVAGSLADPAAASPAGPAAAPASGLVTGPGVAPASGPLAGPGAAPAAGPAAVPPAAPPAGPPAARPVGPLAIPAAVPPAAPPAVPPAGPPAAPPAVPPAGPPAAPPAVPPAGPPAAPPAGPLAVPAAGPAAAPPAGPAAVPPAGPGAVPPARPGPASPAGPAAAPVSGPAAGPAVGPPFFAAPRDPVAGGEAAASPWAGPSGPSSAGPPDR